jgi:hypothetical protein
MLFTAGCAASSPGKIPSSIPFPPDTKVTAPGPGVPADLAFFSGKWVGVWDNTLDHVLVVEAINPPNATVIYAWGDSMQWNTRRGSTRVLGSFENGVLKLSLSRPATATYKPMPDGTLDALYLWSGGSAKAKLTKVIE